MIPLQLTLQGLYSYKEKQQINFERLTKASLFGIFGSVGSGKSTILEAITFALYGDTDRLNKRDDRSYNMMNLKSNELLIDFEFTVRNSERYKTTVKGKRNSKNFSDVKSFERAAYRYKKNTWEPIDIAEIEQIIGLSYENFKRTIIIPQGKFQEFLQLGNKDRTQMMKELFNLNKFELFYQAANLESKNNESIQHTRGQLMQLTDIDEERLIQFKSSLEIIEKEIKHLVTNLEKIKKEHKAYEILAELYKKLEKANSKFIELNERKEYFKKLEEEIKQIEYCLLHFKTLIEEIQKSDQQILEFERVIQTDNQLLEKHNTALKAVTEQIDKIRPDFELKEELRKKADELTGILKVLDFKNERSELIERLHKGTKIVEDTVTQIAVLKKHRAENIKTMQELKANSPDIFELDKSKEWFHQTKKLSDDIEKLNQEKKEISAYQMKIIDESHQLVNQHFSLQLKSHNDYTKVKNELEKITNKIKSELEGLTEQLQHALVQLKLADFSIKLVEGEKCPVCGSTQHPDKTDVQNTSENIHKLKEEESIKKSFLKKSEEVISKLNGSQSIYKLKEEQLQKTDSEHTKLSKLLMAHREEKVPYIFTNEAEITAIYEQVKNNQNKVQGLETESEKILSEIEKKETEIKKFTTKLDEIKHLITSRETEINSTLLGIQTISADEYLSREKSSILSEKEQLLKRAQDAISQYEKLQEQKQNLVTVTSNLHGKIDANVTILEKAKASLNQHKTELDTRIRQSEFSDLNEINRLVLKQPEIEKSRLAIEAYQKDLHSIEEQIRQIKFEISDQRYNREEHEKLLREIAENEKYLKDKNQEKGSVKSKIEDFEKGLIRKQNLEQELEKLIIKAENIKTLKQLFTGSGFVNYISTVHLQNLCTAANERFFKLTGQKLSLEISDDNNFQVRDFMNGGKIRNIKTLSGGQTFQAALSLALALADSIQNQSGSSENFFFLDEGFGSLDKESLGIVFDTLKSLRKESRIVGVISHVEEMQEEIDVHLKIVNDDERGSLVQQE